jgi:hypothetical protein
MVLTKIRIPTQSQLTNPKTYSQLTNVPPEYMINSLIISFINKSLHESYPEYIFDKIIMTNNIDILVSGIGIFIDGNLNMILPGSMLPYSIITDKTTYLIYKSCKCFAQNNSNIHNQIYRYISNLHEKTNAHGFTFIGIGGEPYVYANVLQPIYHKYTFVTDSVDVYESCKYNTRDTQFTGTVESQLLVHRNSVGGKGFCSLFTGEACEKGMYDKSTPQGITDYLMVDYNKPLPDFVTTCKQPVTIIINLVKLYSSVIDLLIALKPYIKSIVIISCNKHDFDKKSKVLVPFYKFEKKEIMCPVTGQCVTVYYAFESEL